MNQQPPELELPPRRPFLGGFLSFGRWADMARIRWYFESVFYYAGQLLIPRKPTRIESFDNTISRFHLSDDDIKRQERFFLYMSLFLFILDCAVIGYAIKLFMEGGLQGGIIASGLSLFIFGLVFRYHFWYFQIKKRKLGCTLQEWFRFLVGR